VGTNDHLSVHFAWTNNGVLAFSIAVNINEPQTIHIGPEVDIVMQ
jgi:hypothetical protein